MAESRSTSQGKPSEAGDVRPPKRQQEPGTEPRLLDLRLAAEDGVPVYQQLVDQLRLLVNTGELAAGARLPSARHLAANLGINRNTALKAYLALAREGLLEGRRGGGTVVVGPSREPLGGAVSVPTPINELVNRLVAASMELTMPTADLLALVALERDVRMNRSSLRVGFVECNPESLGYFVRRLHEEFGVTVVPILIRELAAVASEGGLRDLDCVVSTFFHLSEVRRLFRDSTIGTELFAIGVRPHLSVLEALERLPGRSSIGVAYYERPGDAFAADRLARMADAVRHSGVGEVSVRSVLLKAPPIQADIVGLDALVVRPDNIAPIRDSFPKSLPIIEFVNDLDTASLQFLREVFADFAVRHATRKHSIAAG